MAAFIIGDYFEKNKTQIYDSLQGFILKNGVIGASASIIVGIATVNFLRSASMDLIMPLLNVFTLGFLRFIHKPTFDKISKIFPSTSFNIMHFWHEFFTWAVMIITAVVLLQYALKSLSKETATQQQSKTHQ